MAAVNPRDASWHGKFKSEVTVNGKMMEVMGIGREENQRPGFSNSIASQVYSRNEFHYSFKLTKYLYHSIYGEGSLYDAT